MLKRFQRYARLRTKRNLSFAAFSRFVCSDGERTRLRETSKNRFIQRCAQPRLLLKPFCGTGDFFELCSTLRYESFPLDRRKSWDRDPLIWARVSRKTAQHLRFF